MFKNCRQGVVTIDDSTVTTTLDEETTKEAIALGVELSDDREQLLLFLCRYQQLKQRVFLLAG